MVRHQTLTEEERRERRRAGNATEPFTVTIERVKLAEYAQALHLKNPIYWDQAAAQAAGHRDVVAVPGFITTLTLQQRDAKFSRFGFDESNSLLGEVSWECRETVCAGDRLSGHSVLAEVVRREGRAPMDLLTVETKVTDIGGRLVMVILETHIERRVG